MSARINRNGHVRRDPHEPMVSPRLVPFPPRDNLRKLFRWANAKRPGPRSVGRDRSKGAIARRIRALMPNWLRNLTDSGQRR